MSQADLEVNRGVRRVFVRHWIDLGRLSLRSTAGRVYIRGSLDRIFGNHEEITPVLVDTIFSEIKRVKGVKNVSPDLDNWSNKSGVWHPVGLAEDRKKTDKDHGPGEGGTYFIDET